MKWLEKLCGRQQENVPQLLLDLATDAGRVHAENEDSFYADGIGIRQQAQEAHSSGTALRGRQIFAVFDGMGGEACGAEASAIAAQAFAEAAPRLRAAAPDALQNAVETALREADARIRQMIRERKIARSGATMALVCADAAETRIFSIGDSRIYRIAGGSAEQLTADQTVAARKLRANIYTEEEARASADAHVLTAYIGMDFRAAVSPLQAYPPLRTAEAPLLICSDGLTDLCTDAEIAEIMAASPEHPAAALTARAVANGGTDNVTCIVLRVKA